MTVAVSFTVVPRTSVWWDAAVVVTVLHPGAVTALSSSDTDPLRAKIRPSTVDPVSTLTEVKAMTVPTKVVPVPRVAELPTCQNTLQA